MEAVNPIKDSHKDVIRWVLEDLGKLEQTIFIVNKMDDVANLEDENDYRRNAGIKTKVIRDTLTSFLNLKEEQLKKLNIVCVSANPFNEGLKGWFNNIEEYRELSKLENLKVITSKIVEKNEAELKKEVSKSVIRDVVLIKSNELDEIISEEKQNVYKQKLQLKKLTSDLGYLKSDAGIAVREVKASLENLRDSIFSEIDAATREEFYSVIERNLGVKKSGKNIEVGYLLQQKCQGIIDEAIEGLQGVTQKIVLELEETVAEINDSLQRLGGFWFKRIIKKCNQNSSQFN